MTTHVEATAPARETGASRSAVAFTASWPFVAAWGAGLVQAAIGAGAVVGPDSGIAARAAGIALVTFGLAALAWGLIGLQRGRMPFPRAAIAGALVGVAGDALILMLVPARTSVLAVAVASLLLVVVAVAAASAARRADTAPRTASVWGILLAAAILAAIVTPALGATQDAVLLRDDGTVPVITHDGH